MGVCAPSMPNGTEYRPWHELLYHSSFHNWINTFQPFLAASYPVGGEPVLNVFWQVITSKDFPFVMEMRNLRFQLLFFRLASWWTNLPVFNSPERRILAFTLLFCPLFVPFTLCWRAFTGKQFLPIHRSIYTAGRRMIRTERGLFGLALEDTQVGDKVFLLHGGLTPMVLRRSLSDPDEYELIGECYLHGFMDKLAVDVGECRELSLV
jgi:hypothetical protein